MNRNESPSAAEFGRLIAYMARNGMTAKAAREIIGSSPNGRTREQISFELKEWMKSQ